MTSTVVFAEVVSGQLPLPAISRIWAQIFLLWARVGPVIVPVTDTAAGQIGEDTSVFEALDEILPCLISSSGLTFHPLRRIPD